MKILFKKLSLLIVIAIALGILVPTVLWAERDGTLDFSIRAYNAGNYSMAVRGFEKFLEDYPGDSASPRVMFWRAEGLRQLDEEKRAYRQLLNLYQNYPEFEPRMVVHRLAYLATGLQQQEKIIDLLTAELMEQKPVLQNYLISWLWEAGELDRLAAKLLLLPRQSLTENSKKFLARQQLDDKTSMLIEQLLSGEFDSTTEQELQKLAKPIRKSLLNVVAKNLWEDNQPEILLEIANKFPVEWQSLEFKFYLAEAAVAAENWDQAKQLYSQLHELSRYQAETTFGLAWVLDQHGETGAARELLEQKDWSDQGKIGAEASRLLGNLALEVGDYGAAVRALRRAIVLVEDEKFLNDLRYWLGWSHYRLGDYSEAWRVLEMAAPGEEIDGSQLARIRGRVALQLENIDEAAKHYLQALEGPLEIDERQRVKYDLGQIYYQTGEIKQAFEIFLELSREPPIKSLEPAVNFSLGRTALEQGRANLAWSVFSFYADRLEELLGPEFLYFAGEAALQVGQPGQARDYFERISRDHPESEFVEAAKILGFRAELDQLDPADIGQLEKISKKIEQAPQERRPQMLKSWGEALFDLAEYKSARQRFEQLLEQQPELELQAQAEGWIIQTYIAEADYQTAREEFLALTDRPHESELFRPAYTLINRLYMKRQIESLEELIAHYLDIFVTTPMDAEIYFIRAEVVRSEDRLDEALEDYKKSYQLGSRRPRLQQRAGFRLGQFKLLSGDYERALDYLKDLAEVTPDFLDDDQLNSLLVEALIGIEAYEQAFKYLEKIEQPGITEELFEAQINYGLGRFDQALEQLEHLQPPATSVVAPLKYLWLGKTARELGDYELAEESWFRIIYLYEGWEEYEKVVDKLVDLLEKLGRQEEADILNENS